MAVQNPQDLFIWMLSDVRQRTDKSRQLFREMSQAADDPEIKQTLEAHIYVQDTILSKLDQVFKMIGKTPVSTDTKFHDVYVEDFRRELGSIQAPVAKALYVASKASALMHLHAGEYTALTAMADLSGNYGVGALLESCLADYLAFVERLRRGIRHYIETAAPMRKAA